MSSSSGRQEIQDVRREIDAIDDQIVELIVRRARCASAIARAKKNEGLPVRDPAREAQVLARLKERAAGRLDPLVVERVYERIMELTRLLQERELGQDEP